MKQFPYTAAYGQDKWVESLFAEADPKQERTFLDVGAFDGFKISNTYALEFLHDWTGVLIEGNPRNWAACRQTRHGLAVPAVVGADYGMCRFRRKNSKSGIVGEGTRRDKPRRSDIVIPKAPLADILKAATVLEHFDYASFDIEGAEEAVLTNFPFETYSFGCLTVEQPSLALTEHLIRQGYTPVKRMVMDMGFVSDTFNIDNIEWSRPPHWDFSSGKAQFVEGITTQDVAETQPPTS